MMELAKHWRSKAQRYRLQGVRHRKTGVVTFPPPAILGPDDEPAALSGKGEVWSFTEVAQGGIAAGGYVVALIKLVEGPLITAQMTDVEPDGVAIGQPVEVVTRKLRDLGPDGLLVYGYKFRPVLSDGIVQE
jgi:uncharacterized OB-fold protein